MSVTFEFLGVDFASRVTSWGQVEEIKEVLLAKSQLFVGEVEVTLENSDRALSEDYEFSVLKGVPWYNEIATITENGETLFIGLVKNISNDEPSSTTTIFLENIFSKPSEQSLILTGSGVNPGVALLNFLTEAGLKEFIDTDSFLAAGSQARAAGATIDYVFDTEIDVSVLSAINSVSDLASISVIASKGKFRAQAFKAFQGNQSELREPLAPATVRDFTELSRDQENFINKVVMNYGSGLVLERSDPASQKFNKVVRPVTLSFTDAESIIVPDEQSALFFSDQKLLRSSVRRELLGLILGPEHPDLKVGDRHPITSPYHGLVSAPFEIIETHRTIGSDAIEAVAASLEEVA